MRRDEFLNQLMKHLRYLSSEEKAEIRQEYEAHFHFDLKAGLPEQETSSRLGDPKDIAKELNAVYALDKADERRTLKNIVHAALSIMGLSMANFLLLLMGLFILLLLSPFILAFIIAVPIMILSPLILVGMGIINGFDTVGTPEIVEVIKGVVLGGVLAVLGFYIGKGLLAIVIRNLKWNLSIMKGRA